MSHEPLLKDIAIDDVPKEIIHTLSEDLLARFAALPLLSRYDVYQRLQDYWAETMQDDVYLIAADGWTEAARPRPIVEDQERKIRETPDLVTGRKKWKMDLIPPALVVARFFAAEQAAIDELQAKQEAAARELEEFVEEHSGEHGLLEDAVNDKGKVSKGSVRERLKELQKDRFLGAADDDSAAEIEALETCQALIDAEAEAAKAARDAQAALDSKVLARYDRLTEAEIKTLVVEDKWFAAIQSAIEGEVQRLTQGLAGRVKQLEERYADPLAELVQEVDAFSAKVEKHLKKMGLVWT
jgi:type I restriction enzyme M protein